jgi:ornithine carbamoyltransferase
MTMTATTERPTSHLLQVTDLPAQRFAAALDLAEVMKRHPLAWRSTLDGCAVACYFEQPSTRSRVAFEVAVNRLGALPVMLRPDELQLDRGEHLADTARVLSAYCDAIVMRTHAHRDMLELAQHASVPVINAVSNGQHPCQALADCLALRERFGRLRGLPVAYVGGCTNVTHSLVQAAVLTGMQLHLAAPPDNLADPALLMRAGDTVRTYDYPRDAVAGASAVYTDAWAPRSRQALDDYRVTPELMRLASPRAVFMHPLPAHRGCEVDVRVIDGPTSIVWQQAANLLPAVQAVLRGLITNDWEA